MHSLTKQKPKTFKPKKGIFFQVIGSLKNFTLKSKGKIIALKNYIFIKMLFFLDHE